MTAEEKIDFDKVTWYLENNWARSISWKELLPAALHVSYSVHIHSLTWTWCLHPPVNSYSKILTLQYGAWRWGLERWLKVMTVKLLWAVLLWKRAREHSSCSSTEGHNEMESFYLANSLKRFSTSHHLQNCKASEDLEPWWLLTTCAHWLMK